ncbi:MAG: nucleotidyltransferase family protein [Blastocatellia bacterium]
MPKQNLTHELFPACLRSSLTDELIAQLRGLSADEWTELLRLAVRQRVAPLLHQRLTSRELRSANSSGAFEQLEKHYYYNAIRNQLVLRELRDILRALRAQGIPVIVLKGAYLAPAVYRDPALRVMSDIDLLIPQSRIADAARAVAALGYHTAVSFTPDECFARWHQLPVMHCEGAAASLELHWTLTHPDQPWTIDIDGLWSRAVPFTVAGIEALSLCPEDMLLHLCDHATWHHLDQLFWQGISPVCDIDQLVRAHPQLDWAQVQERTPARDGGKGVFLMLHLAHTLLGTPIPVEVLRALQPAEFSPQVAATAASYLLAQKPVARSGNFARLQGNVSTYEKIRLLVNSLFLSPPALAKQYSLASRSQAWRAYPMRFADLFRRYGHQVWRHWRGDQELSALIQQQNFLLDWFGQK